LVVILEDQHFVVVAHTLLAFFYKNQESTHNMSVLPYRQFVVVEILPEPVNKKDNCKLA
jgi:hypothetical protein